MLVPSQYLNDYEGSGFTCSVSTASTFTISGRRDQPERSKLINCVFCRFSINPLLRNHQAKSWATKLSSPSSSSRVGAVMTAATSSPYTYIAACSIAWGKSLRRIEIARLDNDEPCGTPTAVRSPHLPFISHQILNSVTHSAGVSSLILNGQRCQKPFRGHRRNLQPLAELRAVDKWSVLRWTRFQILSPPVLLILVSNKRGRLLYLYLYKEDRPWPLSERYLDLMYF